MPAWGIGYAYEEEGRASFAVHAQVLLRRRAGHRPGAQVARGVWEPTPNDWWEAGQITRTVGDAHGWDRSKRRDFQNEVLIALTARGHGATVVTANRADFEILGKRLAVPVLIV